MNLLVDPQLGFGHKTFIALGARKRALSSVHALMLEEIRFPHKTVPAVIAVERFDTGVGQPMFHKGAVLSERLPALRTRKRLARVSLLVSQEISFPRETFLALGTLKGGLLNMGGLVLHKIRFLGEMSPAHEARKCAHVTFHVTAQR